MEPKLTAEEEAQQAAEEALADAERIEAMREDWGTSPEQLAQQAMMMSMVGAEG